MSSLNVHFYSILDAINCFFNVFENIHYIFWTFHLPEQSLFHYSSFYSNASFLEKISFTLWAFHEYLVTLGWPQLCKYEVLKSWMKAVCAQWDDWKLDTSICDQGNISLFIWRQPWQRQVFSLGLQWFPPEKNLPTSWLEKQAKCQCPHRWV